MKAEKIAKLQSRIESKLESMDEEKKKRWLKKMKNIHSVLKGMDLLKDKKS